AQRLQAMGNFVDTDKQQRLEQLSSQEKTIEGAYAAVKKHKSAFAAGKNPWVFESLSAKLEQSYLAANEARSKLQTLSFEGRNPYIQAITIDWESEKIELSLFPDLVSFKQTLHAKVKPNQKQ